MKKLLLIPVMLFMGIMMTACGSSKTHTFKTEDFLLIDISGGNGDGTINVHINENECMNRINSDLYNGEGSDVDVAAVYVHVYDKTEYTADKTENLSNGDVVNIVMTAKDTTLKENFGIEYAENTYQYTVTGLAETTALDVFKDFEVYFEGLSPVAQLRGEYKGDNDFIKDNVRYRNASATANFKNGDVVTIQALCNSSVLEENNYSIAEDTKEFVVEGLDEYVYQEFDTTEIDNVFDTYVENKMKTSENFGIGAQTSANGFFTGDNGNTKDIMTVQKQYIEPVRSELRFNEYRGNTYKRYYALSYDVEMSGKDGSSKSTMNVGDTARSENTWIVVAVKNIIRKPDGTLEYDADSIYSHEYIYSVMGNYVGKSVEDIEKADMDGNEGSLVFEK